MDRMISELDKAITDWSKEENRYCMDVIVKNPDELYTYAQSQLEKVVPVKARKEKRLLDVMTVKTLPEGVKLPQSSQRGMVTSWGAGYINSGATVEDFCWYLEQHGIAGCPVVDESGDDYLYDFNFSFAPEDPESFEKAVAGLGLTYEKTQREIEVLVLYQE